MQIEGAIALVTGGSRGLGLAIASNLRSRGATVIAADLDEASLEQMPESLLRLRLDVTRPEDARKALAEIVKKHGRIDILVNNAGVIYSEPFVNIMNPAGIMHDYGRFRDSMTVNLDSVFIMASAAVEQMVTQRTKGVIVNISSISACGNEGQTAYSAAKAAVNALTVTWSKELGRWGIRCNAVAPGFIGTDSTRHALSEAAIKHVQTSTPLRRLGKADEVALAVTSVIENDFINGAILDVNGGLTI